MFCQFTTDLQPDPAPPCWAAAGKRQGQQSPVCFIH